MKNELKLISMDTVETENVQWLWYPYIPLGKITIVQGDPGEGKTTFALAVIASLTKGVLLVGHMNKNRRTQLLPHRAGVLA